ncbi:MAG: flavin reductase family protein [Elusimicrobia bacterium]|nr:flavin reductase family protein [Elusimicrobiota bacterium]
MNNYKSISKDISYRLVNHGPLVMISTRSAKGEYDIAPVAWCCPADNSPSRILIAIDPGHMTYSNIKETGEFTVCVPNASQADLARKTGSVSGRDADKFAEFGIEHVKTSGVDTLVPTGCVGYICCKVFSDTDSDGVALVIGEAVEAAAHTRGFSDRVLIENEQGRTLHHLGGGTFGILSDNLDIG